MKRLLLSLGFVSAFAGSASAVLNLNLSNPVMSVPFSASAQTVTIFGSVTGVTSDVTSATLSAPAGSGITIAADPAFSTYVNASGANTNYGSVGSPLAIAVLSIPAGLAIGVYDGPNAFVTVNDARGLADNEYYEVDVVPEPASFAALAIGAVALVRRRKSA